MIDIEAIPMPYGDCFVLRWTDGDGTPRLVLLDSGTSAAYRAVLRRLLREIGRPIDVWVISHPHNDHIGGAIRYFSDINMPVCREWWLNSFHEVSGDARTRACDGTLAASPAQARALDAAIAAAGVPVRCLRAGDALTVGNLSISVLSPMDADVRFADSDITPHTTDGTIAAASAGDDYETRLDGFSSKPFIEDDEPFNRASISLLLEHEGRRFLWMADSSPSVVCASLRKMGYSCTSPLECDYATISHHGSRGNTSPEWASLVRARNYIVTSDASNVHDLPHKEALARILCAERMPGSPVLLCFPCATDGVQRIFRSDGPDVFSDYRFSIRMAFNRFSL